MKQPPAIREMRALSVMQPWAYCIAHKGKNVENRPRTTHMRGTIAIHASAGRDPERFEWLKDDHNINLDPNTVPFGAIVAFADIVDVITKKQVTGKTKKWFQGDYGYVLENVVVLKKPIAVKGALSFWKLKGTVLKKCLEQVPAGKRRRFKPFQHPPK